MHGIALKLAECARMVGIWSQSQQNANHIKRCSSMVSFAPLPSRRGEGQKERALEEQGKFGGRGDFMENFYVIMVQSGLRGFKETDLV
jgi:hypothetical protein